MTISTLTPLGSAALWPTDHSAAAPAKPAPHAPVPAQALRMADSVDRFRPTPPRQRVSAQTSQQSLDRVLTQSGLPLTATNFEGKSVAEVMAAAAAGLYNNNLKLAEIDTKGQQNRIEATNQIRLKQCDDLRQQIDQALADQKKAQKSGILGTICNWITAAVKLVVGVAKLVTGNVVGGLADLAAGVAGVVKAVASTLALADPKHADTYNKIADIAGKVEMSFDLVGMGFDIGKAAKGLMGSKGIGRATSRVMQSGEAGKALTGAIKEGTKAGIESAAKQIAKETAELTSETLKKSLAKASKDMIERFSTENVEKLVQKAVTDVATQTVKNGGEVTLKAVAKQVEREVRQQIAKTVFGASVTTTLNIAKQVTTVSLSSSAAIGKHAIDLDRAKLQRAIQRLIADMDFQQALVRAFQAIIANKQDAAKDEIKSAGQALQGGLSGLNQLGAAQMMITAAA